MIPSTRFIPPTLFFLLCLTIDICSFFGWVFPWASTLALVSIVGIVGVYSLKDLRYGIISVYVELILSSQGYLFATTVLGFRLSLRFALFGVVMCAAVYHVLRTKELAIVRAQWFRWFCIVCAGIVYGIVNAVLRGHPLSAIFFDVNAWLFLGMMFPLTQALRSRADIAFVVSPLIWALWWLAIKTVALFVIFSHPETFQGIASIVYTWIRDTRVAEIFRFESGFARVFLQSHIYALCAWIVLCAYIVRQPRAASRSVWALYVAMTVTVLISYSRTFWLFGAIVVVGTTIIIVMRNREILRFTVRTLGAMCAATFFACAIVVALVRAPFPFERVTTNGGLFIERVSNTASEAAAVTRMQELRPLLNAIERHLILGSGFGATVTYHSVDPKVLATHPDGAYTTSAFEWAYLDIAYKLGVIGFGAVIIPIMLFFWCAVRKSIMRNEAQLYALSASVAVVLGVHVLTPYINHPLGLGVLMFALIYLDLDSKHI